jgi:hypothetical protein
MGGWASAISSPLFYVFDVPRCGPIGLEGALLEGVAVFLINKRLGLRGRQLRHDSPFVDARHELPVWKTNGELFAPRLVDEVSDVATSASRPRAAHYNTVLHVDDLRQNAPPAKSPS